MFMYEVSDPWVSPSRQRWTTLVSFTLQIAGVGLLLVLPLFYTRELPEIYRVRPISLPLASAASSGLEAVTRSTSNSNTARPMLVVPPSLPARISTSPDHGDDVLAPAFEGVMGLRSGSGLPASANSLLRSIGSGFAPFVPPRAATVRRPPRVSALMQGYLVHKVEPIYPPLARSARIQGVVEFKAVIGREGTIEKLEVLSGHPMLVKSAIDAVRQWRYRPYFLNGRPVEVETHITVNFSLAGL
jgi:protein TonB